MNDENIRYKKPAKNFKLLKMGGLAIRGDKPLVFISGNNSPLRYES
jgi:hypothetical protein